MRELYEQFLTYLKGIWRYRWIMMLVAWLVNEHLTIAGAWGYLGEIGNTDADCVYGIQVKYEF